MIVIAAEQAKPIALNHLQHQQLYQLPLQHLIQSLLQPPLQQQPLQIQLHCLPLSKQLLVLPQAQPLQLSSQPQIVQNQVPSHLAGATKTVIVVGVRNA